MSFSSRVPVNQYVDEQVKRKTFNDVCVQSYAQLLRFLQMITYVWKRYKYIYREKSRMRESDLRLLFVEVTRHRMVFMIPCKMSDENLPMETNLPEI